MGLSLSTAVSEHAQHNLRQSNIELQRKVTRLEKEIKATINQNMESLDRLKAELTDSKKILAEQKKYYENEIKRIDDKVSFFRDKSSESEKKYKLLESKCSELQNDNQKLLSAIKTIDDISDKFD